MSCSPEFKDIRFSFEYFHAFRFYRGIPAARFMVSYPSGDTDLIWLSRIQIEDHMQTFGSQSAFLEGIKAYRKAQLAPV